MDFFNQVAALQKVNSTPGGHNMPQLCEKKAEQRNSFIPGKGELLTLL